MKQDDFNKAQIDLSERMNKNKELIRSYLAKLKLFKMNSFEENFFGVFSCGVSVWSLSLVALGVLFSVGDVTVITNFIPLDFLPWVINSITVISGIIGRQLLMKKEKKRFKEISKAKNSFQRRTEALQYNIALEKVESRNKVIEWVMSTLKSRQRYHVHENNWQLTSRELNERIEEIAKGLKESYQALDLCATKRVLISNLRGNNERFVVETMLVACMKTFTAVFPVPFLISYDVNVINFLLPFVFAGLISTIYVLRRKSENKKIINKYRSYNLEEYDYKKEFAIESECMLNIREAEIQLQEYLCLLKNSQLAEKQSCEEQYQKAVVRYSVFEQTVEDMDDLKEEKGPVKRLRR